MARPKKSMLRPMIIFLIGIIIIALSFVFWYFTISPISTVDRYAIRGTRESETMTNGSSLILYFGTIFFQESDQKNKSRPVDISLDMEIKVETTTEPVSVTIYVRDTPIFLGNASATAALICNSTVYDSSPSAPNVYRNVTSAIPVSLLDAFTGGTTPYMIIKNLSPTKSASITYQYVYGAEFRNGHYIPLLLFIIGAIITVFEGIGLLRYGIKRVRQR